MEIKLDTTKEGLYTLFKPYQVMLLEHIWELNEDGKDSVGSGRAHEYIQTTSDKKSRASVIFFLNDMVDEGVLDFDDETGKGGHHRMYYPKMSRGEFAEYVVKQVAEALGRTFPESRLVQKIAKEPKKAWWKR